MITNERQHRITKSQIKRFEEAISRAQREGPASDVDRRLHEAMIDGMRSQLEDLRNELDGYEALRDGKVKERIVHSLLEIPRTLIEGRIAGRLTQKELGKRLGIPEQQVQRYEQTRYNGVAIDRLQEVANALEMKFKKTIEYGVPRTRSTGKAHTTGKRPSTRLSTASSALTATRGSKGDKTMASSGKTGRAAASAAGKTLGSKSASKTAKRAAASDLAQVGNRKVTGKKAASAAGKTLVTKGRSKTAKRAAASDLSQAARKKR